MSWVGQHFSVRNYRQSMSISQQTRAVNYLYQNRYFYPSLPSNFQFYRVGIYQSFYPSLTSFLNICLHDSQRYLEKYIYNESITFGRQNQFLNKLPFGLSGYVVLQSLSPESVSFIYGDSCHQTQHLHQRSGNAQPAASLPLLASLCFLWSLHHMFFSADPLS